MTAQTWHSRSFAVLRTPCSCKQTCDCAAALTLQTVHWVPQGILHTQHTETLLEWLALPHPQGIGSTACHTDSGVLLQEAGRWTCVQRCMCLGPMSRRRQLGAWRQCELGRAGSAGMPSSASRSALPHGRSRRILTIRHATICTPLLPGRLSQISQHPRRRIGLSPVHSHRIVLLLCRSKANPMANILATHKLFSAMPATQHTCSVLEVTLQSGLCRRQAALVKAAHAKELAPAELRRQALNASRMLSGAPAPRECERRPVFKCGRWRRWLVSAARVEVVGRRRRRSARRSM